MLFFCVLFWTENLVFSRARSLSKQSVFRKCFFCRKSWGGRGGGRILGCALTPRWLELDLRCCMAKRTPKKKVKREGAGSAWAETCNLAAYWLQSLATLAADKQEAKGRARAAALFFSGIAPRQWKRDTAGQRQ